MHAAICCVTYRRPDGIRQLLQSLNELTFAKNPTPKITVIVVDNDSAAPAQPIVERLRPGYRWQLCYAVEPMQGVASARNRSLDLVPLDADYIAMIDDDEIPVAEWLDELLEVSREFRAEVVQGPVKPVFRSAPPAWLERSQLLELGPYLNGAPLGFGYCGNSLMMAAAVRSNQLRFEPDFDLTGGEDQRFFGQAIEKGLGIVTSERGIVYESVPVERARLSYLLRRRFRMGNTLAKIDRLEGGRRRVASRMLKGVGRLGLGVAQSASVVNRGAAGGVIGLCNVAWGAGSLAGCFGVTYEEYGTKRSQARPSKGSLTAVAPSSVAGRLANGFFPRRFVR